MTESAVNIDNAMAIWPNQLLEAENDAPKLDDKGRFSYVSAPQLVPYLSNADRNGAAILICPGGGYARLAWLAHVQRLALRFNPLGISVIGLMYRTSPPSDNIPDDPVADFDRALEIIHERAEEWRIAPQKIVGLGFSAGANLLLNYACIPASIRSGRKLNYMALLCLWPHGKSADDYDVCQDAPDTFLCATEEDQVAPVEFSQAIAGKLQSARINVYPKGDHLAFNFNENGPEVDWTPGFLTWLGEKNLLPDSSSG